jgi:drug/metabolite transporter (DMT)-like permease
VLSWWTLGEHVSRAALAGLLAGFAGVVVMLAPQLGGTGDTGDLVVGIVVSLIASLAWAVGTLIVKWLASRDELEPLGFTVAQFVSGAPVLLVIAFVAEGAASTDWSSGDLWGSVAFLAFGSSCLGTVGFFAALRRLPATRSSSVQFLAPVVAVLIEIGRGHTPETVVLLGMALAIVGVAVVVVGDALLTAFRLRTAAARA